MMHVPVFFAQAGGGHQGWHTVPLAGGSPHDGDAARPACWLGEVDQPFADGGGAVFLADSDAAGRPPIADPAQGRPDHVVAEHGHRPVPDQPLHQPPSLGLPPGCDRLVELAGLTWPVAHLNLAGWLPAELPLSLQRSNIELGDLVAAAY